MGVRRSVGFERNVIVNQIGGYEVSFYPKRNAIPVLKYGFVPKSWVRESEVRYVSNADKVDGYDASVVPLPNKIVVSDVDGKINPLWLKMGYSLNVIPNWNFKYDFDQDGLPDKWDIGVYSGGQVEWLSYDGPFAFLDKMLKFSCVSSGGGGGYLVSDFIDIFVVPQARFLWLHLKTSSVNLPVSIELRWYDANKQVVWVDSLVLNSLNFVRWGWVVIPVFEFFRNLNVKYLRVKIDCIPFGSGVTGSVFVGSVLLVDEFLSLFQTFSTNQGVVSTTSTSYVDVGSAVSLNIPEWAGLLCVNVASYISSSSYNVYVRFRIGSVYSSEFVHNVTSYRVGILMMDVSSLSGSVNLNFQMRVSGGTGYLQSVFSDNIITLPMLWYVPEVGFVSSPLWERLSVWNGRIYGIVRGQVVSGY